jgi:hypothetical protein
MSTDPCVVDMATKLAGWQNRRRITIYFNSNIYLEILVYAVT